jgi:hypothetical protein
MLPCDFSMMSFTPILISFVLWKKKKGGQTSGGWARLAEVSQQFPHLTYNTRYRALGYSLSSSLEPWFSISILYLYLFYLLIYLLKLTQRFYLFLLH